MPRRKVYSEGDWFLVPLDRRPGQYGRGLVARKSRGGILLGFFFGPVLDRVPSESEWRDRIGFLRPADAAYIGLFGDLGLQDDGWPVLGRSPTWKVEREGWRPPDFGHVDAVDPARGFLRSYDSEDPSSPFTEVETTAEESRAHWPDGLFGHVALRMRLMRVLLAQDNHEMLTPFSME